MNSMFVFKIDNILHPSNDATNAIVLPNGWCDAIWFAVHQQPNGESTGNTVTLAGQLGSTEPLDVFKGAPDILKITVKATYDYIEDFGNSTDWERYQGFISYIAKAIGDPVERTQRQLPKDAPPILMHRNWCLTPGNQFNNTSSQKMLTHHSFVQYYNNLLSGDSTRQNALRSALVSRQTFRIKI